ncbi:hypothetical protein K4F52_008417 [Lecanicillium sp. MT-2017a]|nr:hypothetical protein K4F52_008417 [Lecanicillium sp. MT-2017a]
MASWELLDERTEQELHKSRLLNVEEKPFKRITKRLGTISSAISQATEPRDGDENGGHPDTAANTLQIQEDLTLDFAAFGSSIARLQFLHDANERERVRYDADKQRILDECQDVRGKNTQLREQLDGARATLAQRKKFDELAEKITSNRLLRPREDQIANLAKLEEECKELERESETYSETWKERRDQFNRIMEEGMLLRRQIRDEKEEVDRREGMNEGTEEDADGQAAAGTPRNEQSGHATPLPGGEEAKNEDDGEAKDNEQDSGTPLPGADTPSGDHLRVPGGTASRTGSSAPTRDATPMPAQDKSEAEEGEDTDMDGDESSAPGPAVTVDTPAAGEDMEVDD